MTSKLKTIVALCLLLGFTAPLPSRDAHAIVPGTTTTLVAAGIAAGVYLTMEKQKEDEEALAQYLEHNRVSVQEALVWGHGDAAEDLALFFKPVAPELDQATWHVILRENRSELSRVLVDAHHVDDDAAYDFAMVIVTALDERDMLDVYQVPEALER